MRLFSFFFSLAYLFATTFAWADQLIVEPDMGREPIINAMHAAHHSIHLVMYGWTDDTLLQALLQQKKEGRQIQIILEQAPYKNEQENSKTIAALTEHAIPWQGRIEPFRLIHQKTLIIDHQQALVMTFNFTRASFKNERNFALIIDDPKRVRAITETFAADWHHQPLAQQMAELIWSPENSREKFLRFIQQAKQTIHIYAQSISDGRIIDALVKAAHKGVKINILTSRPLREKQANHLARAGIMVKLSRHYYIHAKVMIIDQQKAILGSVNFTRASLDYNRELAVLTTDTQVIKQLSAVFSQDWHQVNQPPMSQRRHRHPPHHLLYNHVSPFTQFAKRYGSMLQHATI